MSTLHQLSASQDDASCKGDVLFLHGLGGDPVATWRYGEDESTSWPHWLGEEFPEVNVRSYGYAASPSQWSRMRSWFSKARGTEGHSMALPRRGLQTLDYLAQQGIGERPLVWVCHSLGGLLAKQVLRTARDSSDPQWQAVFGQTRAVLFLATPHAGTELATLADFFRDLFGTTVSIEELKAHDAHLEELFNWYRHHSAEAGIETVTYYEQRPVKNLVMIVTPSSAHPGVGSDPVALDEDHISIAKPRERSDQVCGAARQLILAHLLEEKSAPVAAEVVPTGAPAKLKPASLPPIEVRVSTPAVPDESRVPRGLPPAAEHFVGREEQLEALIERLRAGKDTAVVGPAGMGKTALAAEALAAVVGPGASALAVSPFPDGIVFLDLYGYHGEAEPAWSSLANTLAGADFLEAASGSRRATEACRGRAALVAFEGGEEADGLEGRATFAELKSVLSPENRWLLLTRDSTQAETTRSVRLDETLTEEEARELFETLTGGGIETAVRDRVLGLLKGHPLALSWAGNLLARGDEDAGVLAEDWEAAGLPSLTDPEDAKRSLAWLFERSIRGLELPVRRSLAAAGLLARAPFPLEAIEAAVEEADREALRRLVQRGMLRLVAGSSDSWEFTHVLAYQFARRLGKEDAAIRVRLGTALRTRLEADLAAGLEEDGGSSLNEGLKHAGALLRAGRDRELWESLANELLYSWADRLISLGRSDLVGSALGAVADWLDRLDTTETDKPGWLHQRWSSLTRLGDLATAQGNLSEAERLYGEALEIAKRLAEADPGNAQWQRDLSVSFNKLGNLATAQGNLSEAERLYGEDLEIAKRLAEADPGNAQWQRDLSVSFEKLGNLATAQGNLSEAERLYGEALEIAKRLAEADPGNAQWQRDLSVSFEKLGNLATAQGNLSEAERLYGEALEIRKRLAEADPGNAEWQRDLSVSFEKLGNLATAQGNLSEAERLYGEALEIRKRLAEADPGNAEWQRDLSVSFEKLGNLATAQGNLSEAERLYGEALEIRKRLAEADPGNAQWQRDLSYVHTRIGQLQMEHARWKEALALLETSLEIDERLAASDPTNATWRKDVEVSRRLVAEVRAKLG